MSFHTLILSNNSGEQGDLHALYGLTPDTQDGRYQEWSGEPRSPTINGVPAGDKELRKLGSPMALETKSTLLATLAMAASSISFELGEDLQHSI